MRLGLSLAITQPRSGAGGGAFDLTSLAWTGLWQVSYSGSPWVGSASAGSSGGRNLTEATNPPASGGPLNGFTPPDFDATNDRLDTGAVLLSDLIGNSCGGVVLFNADTSSADGGAGTRFANPQFLIDTNAILGVGFSTAGVHLAALDTGATTTEVVSACGTGGWHLLRWRVTDATTIEVGVDSGAMVSTSFAGKTLHGSRGTLVRVGCRANGGAPFFDGRVAFIATAAFAPTDPQFVNIRGGINARYNLAL